MVPNQLPRAALAAEQLDGDTVTDPEDYDDESLDEEDYPPELQAAVNEAFGIQHRASRRSLSPLVSRMSSQGESSLGDDEADSGASAGFDCESINRVFTTVGAALSEVMWSMQELAFKVILDIGCMRSVAGLEWTNELLRRWRSEGRWCHVFAEREAFKFGDGEVLFSRFRVEFMGSFAGKPVVYGFSVVGGSCPPLFSRTGCTQIGAVLDCEHHQVST